MRAAEHRIMRPRGRATAFGKKCQQYRSPTGVRSARGRYIWPIGVRLRTKAAEDRHIGSISGRVGERVGTVVMLVNATLLTGYLFGCHSWRHLIGGRLDCFTCDGAVSPRYRLWKSSTWLNERHMPIAWVSLVWVVFTDLYIYLLSTGAARDLNTWQ